MSPSKLPQTEIHLNLEGKPLSREDIAAVLEGQRGVIFELRRCFVWNIHQISLGGSGITNSTNEGKDWKSLIEIIQYTSQVLESLLEWSGYAGQMDRWDTGDIIISSIYACGGGAYPFLVPELVTGCIEEMTDAYPQHSNFFPESSGCSLVLFPINNFV
ncbi:hypothetical protein HZA38_05000 [Candidatus Peregrinibacteria bacterium]|nr:hypothetical protein [Candidatus Peregrinibacteria bacterium]